MKNKSKLKNYLFKTLHIIGYISTFLVILFSILVCVNSCNNTDNTDRNNNNKENKSVLSVLREEKKPNYFVKNSDTSITLSQYDLYNTELIPTFINYYHTSSGTNTNLGNVSGSVVYRPNSSNYTTDNASYNIDHVLLMYGNYASPYGSYFTLRTYAQPSYYLCHDIVYEEYRDMVQVKFIPTGGTNYYQYPIISLTLTNLPSALVNSISSLYSSGGDYTAEDLEEAYQEGYWSGEDVGYDNGYSEGYDIGYYNGFNNANNENFSNFNLLINSQTNFNYLATDQYLTQYLPNVYRLNNLQLNEFQSSYTFHDIEFTYEGSDHVYNSISVVFKKLSDFNYNALDGEITFLAFTDSDITLNNTLSDYVNYKGCTSYTNLLGLDNLSRFYYLDSISYYYDDLEQEGEIITDNLQVFEGKKYINNLTLYVSDNSANPTLVTSNQTRTGLAFVKNGWLNENYRKLYVISNNNQLLDVQNTALNNYTLVEFLSGAYINPNNGATTTEVNNMFDMFSLAFTGIIPILNVQLLPYITIGSLLFVPLIITIILIVIKLLKRG